MIPVAASTRVGLLPDMHKGFDGVAAAGSGGAKHDRSRRLLSFAATPAGLIKLIWHDGQGLCLFAKRLERGRFNNRGAVAITPASAHRGCRSIMHGGNRSTATTLPNATAGVNYEVHGRPGKRTATRARDDPI